MMHGAISNFMADVVEKHCDVGSFDSKRWKSQTTHSSNLASSCSTVLREPEDQSVSMVTIDQNKNPSNCNQDISPRLFLESVIKFQHTAIHSCLHGSIISGSWDVFYTSSCIWNRTEFWSMIYTCTSIISSLVFCCFKQIKSGWYMYLKHIVSKHLTGRDLFWRKKNCWDFIRLFGIDSYV